MARTATRTSVPTRASARGSRDDAPPLDPHAVSRNYRLYRERRRARAQRERAKRWAAVRFWAALALAVGAAVFLALRTMGEIERVFGL